MNFLFRHINREVKVFNSFIIYVTTLHKIKVLCIKKQAKHIKHTKTSTLTSSRLLAVLYMLFIHLYIFIFLLYLYYTHYYYNLLYYSHINFKTFFYFVCITCYLIFLSVFVLFYRQQTICLKNKNALKSILVRHIFRHFSLNYILVYFYVFFTFLLN